MNEVDEDGFAIRPNKTQLKKELHALNELVLQMIALSEREQQDLALTPQIMAGLHEARGMRANSARKRLVKHLTKLLSREDADRVKQYFTERATRQQQQNHAFHQLELLRDRMIEQGDPVLQAFLDQHAAADRQQLRQALRNARKEKESGKPAGAGRKLFGLLRDAGELP